MQSSNLEDDTASFVLECRARLQVILQRLEWSQEGVLKNFNTNSSAVTNTEPKKPKQTLFAEVRDYPASCSTSNSFVLVTPELQKLLQDDKLEAPKNFYDLQANFSREQKLQIYEHVIQNTKKLDNNTVDKVPDGEQSLAEIVAENKREANRKKRKFRIAKPTRIEEVRALVELQMRSLQQFIRNQKDVDSNIRTSVKEKYAHGEDSRTDIKDSNRSFHRAQYSKSYTDKQTEEKYKSSRSSTEKYDRFKSNCAQERESSRNSSRNPNKFFNERKDSRSKYNERNEGQCSRWSSSSDIKVQREYERHKLRTRSRSPELRKYHKDKHYKKSETYEKPNDYFDHNKRKRSRSMELDKLRSGKSSKSEKLDYKVSNGERHKDIDYHRRSKSREKHRHHKHKYKETRSRSKSRDHSKHDMVKKNKHK